MHGDLWPGDLSQMARMLRGMKKFLVLLLIVGLLGVVYKMVIEKDA